MPIDQASAQLVFCLEIRNKQYAPLVFFARICAAHKAHWQNGVVKTVREFLNIVDASQRCNQESISLY